MLKSIVEFSLRFRGVVVTLACLLTGYGIHIASHAKMDVFPDFVPPQVSIQTEAPGLAPEQVEILVTRPVEAAINGLGRQESLRSESIQGLSIITAVFKEGTDVFLARQMLSERLGEVVSQLPLGVKPPKMTPLTSSTMDLLKIGIISDQLSQMDLRTFADWTLKPRLLAVAGVAKCSVFGGEVRQWQIQVDPEKLQAFGLSISDVQNAARLATGVRGAGFIETTNQRVIIQTEGQALTADSLGEVVLVGATNGLSVRLRDVARVVESAEPKFGDTLVQGRAGVLLTMSSQYGANTLEVTRALEAALAEMRPVFAQEGITLFPRLHRPATFIESALRNMAHSLWLGGVLVAVVLFLFLGHFRTAFISITAIPLSLLTAVVILEKLGVTLNTITLGGLVIAIGEVVDDAIIDVENIFRRLQENQRLGLPRSTLQVVLDASLEVRSAIVHATFIVALVFLPVVTLTGLSGSFFAPLALSYLLAILASLGVALTLTPALSLLFFARGVREAREPALQRGLKAIYVALLQRVLRWPRTVMALALFCCMAALAFLPSTEGAFLPEFREGHFVLQVNTAPGTSLPEMLRFGRRISEALLQHPHIATVEQQIGRAEQGEDPWGPHRSEFHVDLKPISGSEEATMGDEIRAILEKFPGIQFEVLTFLGDRIGETITGETAPVVVNLFGEDLDELDAGAQEVAAILRAVPGAADVQVKSPPGSPRLDVRLRPDRLTQLGFRPVEVLDAIQTAYQGNVVAQTYRGNVVTDVAVLLAGPQRQDPETLADLNLRNAQGLRVPLRELAEIEATSGRHSILHDGARRRQTVTCAVSGREIGAFVREARARVGEKVKLPRGVYVAFTGAADAARSARQELLLHSSIAGVGILLLLFIVLRRPRNVALVLANVPFALVGGVLAIWVASLAGAGHEAGLTIGTLVGFVTLFGITMRNSIMLISHYDHLVTVEGMAWGLDVVLRGATERFVPIVMTALCAGLGLVPLALGGGEAGREIEGPMAVVILGGLITSTALNLVVMPVLYWKFGQASVSRSADGLQDARASAPKPHC